MSARRIHQRWPLHPSGMPNRTDSDWTTARVDYQRALDRWYVTWLMVIVSVFLVTVVAGIVS